MLTLPARAPLVRKRRAVLSAGGVLIAAFVALAALVATRFSPLISEDHAADIAAHTAVLHHAMLLAAAFAATTAGSPLVVNLIAVVVAAGLLIARRVHLALYLIAAVLTAFAIETIVKYLLARPRPVLAQAVAHAQVAPWWNFGGGPVIIRRRCRSHHDGSHRQVR